MTEAAFYNFIEREPLVREAIRRALAQPSRESFSLVTDVALMALVYPVISAIIHRIGLPWLDTARRYSELWRNRVDGKLDDEYRRRGIDPVQARRVADAIRQEWESTANLQARAVWERLAALIKKDVDDGD